ncbi:MAG: FAD-dependent oxidoreductase [Verrucomicrobiaceae bacterium]|nr:FAD-dependent oxidoreductase [Verrucomicrobiaceae bacterium]
MRIYGLAAPFPKMNPGHITILGAGIAGLSTSFHLGHGNCSIFERDPVHGGHAGSENFFGFTVDRGPHVSFTKNAYVKELFAKNVNRDFLEFPVRTRNLYQGTWIEHPAQAHLWQIPQPLRNICADEMIHAAGSPSAETPRNYRHWLELSYGKTFASNFPAAYTRKYWTTDPVNLSVDWLGPRMPKLDVKELQAGLVPETYQNLHYITSIRYPKSGGYQSFFDAFSHNADIHLAKQISSIDLVDRNLWFADGSRHQFDRLVSTIPLPDFVNRCVQVTDEVRQAAADLDCSQLLIVDIFAPHLQELPGHWFYVYDEDKWATRIHCIERLAPGNTPDGWTGVQVEVYFSKHKPYPGNPSTIAKQVAGEMVEMGFISGDDFAAGRCKFGWRWAPYANVIFTHPRRGALEKIWNWLERYGLLRRSDDLDATTDWTREPEPEGLITMAGRFAEWKYHWTDDCTLRGRQIALADKLAI